MSSASLDEACSNNDFESALLGMRCRGHQDVNLSSTYIEACSSIRSRIRFGEAPKSVQALSKSAPMKSGASIEFDLRMAKASVGRFLKRGILYNYNGFALHRPSKNTLSQPCLGLQGNFSYADRGFIMAASQEISFEIFCFFFFCVHCN